MNGLREARERAYMLGGGWRGFERVEREPKKTEYEKSNSHCRAAEKNDGKKQIIYKNNIVSGQRETCTRYLPCRHDRCTVIPDGVPSTPAPALAHLCAPPPFPQHTGTETWCAGGSWWNK